jgi:formiminotetrahydrofolate cyclodeaminase
VLKEMTLKEFGEVLGSNSPAPGGGSVAALSGMLGANLVSMVCRLTIGKKGYEGNEEEASTVLGEADRLAQSLLSRIDLDTEAFNEVMAGFKLPKVTDEEKAARTAAIQEGYKSAIQSPQDIARECLDVLRLAERLLGRSNANAISDLGVAGQQAYAGVEGALMNVRINLPSIKDAQFVAAVTGEIDNLQREGRMVAEAIYASVTKDLAPASG